MKKLATQTERILRQLGNIRWDGNDAFVVVTKEKVTLVVSPNECHESECPKNVILDEIQVPLRLRRKGRASKAMKALCRLADEYQFLLLGGPIGFTECPWREKFLEWVRGFGFERDPSEWLRSNDPNAFYVRRLPRGPKHRH